MEKEKWAYISILATEDYLDGVKVLYKSLRRFTDKEFLLLVNEEISETVVQALSELGMRVIRVVDIKIQPGVLSEKMQGDRWRHTLYKLRVFGMTEYDTLVYLDSDMLVCGNLDDLFLKKSMSAVSDKTFFPEYGRAGINAGVFTFRPSKELEQNLIELIPETATKMEVFGDQDVLNMYFVAWETETDRHLDIKYNACFYQLDAYHQVIPLVVHFILGSKPWMWSKSQILKNMKWLLQGKRKQRQYFKEYLSLLKSVR